MENVQDGQDQYQLQPEIGVYSHADCPVCNGDEKAVARQARLEASAEKLFEPLDRMGDHLENAYLNVKGIIKPNGAHVGQGTSLSLRRGGRHQLPAKPNALSQLAGKQVAAGALAFLSAASPAAADVLDATQTLPPAVAEAPPELNIKPSAFSPEIMIERYRNNTRETIAAPLAGYEPEMLPASAPAPEPETEKIAAGVEQPLIRTLFPGQTIRDFVNTVAGDLPREQRVSLIEQIAQDSGVDLAAGEDRNLKVGFELKIPIETAGLELYTVKKGDTAAQLYDKLGFKDAGYSFDQFLQAQAIVDKDSIRTGWAMFKPADADHLTVALADKPNPPTPPSAPTAPGNEPVPVPPRKPETVLSEPVPKQPQTIDGPPDNGQLAAITRHLQTELPEIGLVVVDEDQISLENGRYMNRQEAGSALDLLIETISDYENPLHDMPVSPMEQEPTPEADRLRANRSDLIDDLTDGNTNLAFVQSEVLQRLSAQSNGRVDAEQMQDIASHFVRFIAERNDWVLSDEEAGNLAGLMIRGAMPIDLSGASHARLEAASLSERFNHSALTVDLYDASLREHLDEQVELVRLAEQQLELLRSNMRDLSEDELRAIAQTTIAATLSGQPTNDYSYEVFRAKIGEQVNEATVLKLLGRQFYASRDSDDLLELLPSVEAKLAETVDGWLAAEGPKSLSGLLETIDSQLDGQIAAITERGEQLQELELDLEELDPALTDLNGEQIYELAKTILSAEEKQQRVGDDWLYLIELKAPAGESLDQTLLNLEEGIYRVQGADLLLSGSEQEQAAVAEAIEQFLAGSERNVKAFLDTQFGSLEQRLATAESEVMAIVELAAGVLPEWSMSEDKLSALPVRRLVGLTNQGLIDELKKTYTAETGRQLTPEQGALIDIGLIRLETPDQADRLDQFSLELLEYFNQQNASFYLTGADDPAVRTLAQMLEEGRHTVDYSDGEMSIFSDEFMDKLRAYNTIPSSLFPGNQWLIKGYAGQDLRPFFERLGLDADAILASPYNDRLKLADGQITADANGAIWFSAELWGGGKSPDFEEATEWTYGEIPGLSYTVKKGQTYGEIANMFRVDGKVPDWHEIIEWNRGRIPSDPTKLRVGTEVVIPQGWAVYFADLENPPSIEIDIGADITNRGVQNTRNAIANNARTQLERDVVEDAGRNRDSRGIIVHYCNGQDRQWEWCACFASTMLKDSGIDVEGRYGHVEPGALRLMELLKDDPRFEFISPDKIGDNTDLATGDLVFYTRGEGKGHVGVVDHVKDTGLAVTIDGNMGDRLAERRLDVAGHERFIGVIRYVGEPEPAGQPAPEKPAEEVAPAPEPQPAPEPAPQPETEADTSSLVTESMIENIDQNLSGVSADKVQDFARRAVQIMRDNGIEPTPQGLAAYMAHISSESDFMPEAVGDNGKSFGIFQAQGGRNDGLPGDLDGQIAFSFDDMRRDGRSMGYDLIAAIQNPNASLEEVVETGFDWLRPQAHIDKNDAKKAHRFESARHILEDMKG